MGDEFGEVTEDVKEDFTPTEGLEEAEVEEIPEDTEEKKKSYGEVCILYKSEKSR